MPVTKRPHDRNVLVFKYPLILFMLELSIRDTVFAIVWRFIKLGFNTTFSNSFNKDGEKEMDKREIDLFQFYEIKKYKINYRRQQSISIY